MKLIIAIINSDDIRNVLERLGAQGFSATVSSSAGGFLHVSNATIFCGVDDEEMEDALAIIRQNCTSRIQYVTPLPPVMEPGEMHIPAPVEKHVGGATIFVVDVEKFEKV